MIRELLQRVKGVSEMYDLQISLPSCSSFTHVIRELNQYLLMKLVKSNFFFQNQNEHEESCKEEEGEVENSPILMKTRSKDSSSILLKRGKRKEIRGGCILDALFSACQFDEDTMKRELKSHKINKPQIEAHLERILRISDITTHPPDLFLVLGSLLGRKEEEEEEDLIPKLIISFDHGHCPFLPTLISFLRRQTVTSTLFLLPEFPMMSSFEIPPSFSFSTSVFIVIVDLI